MKEAGKRRGILYGITRTFTSRDWATQGIREPNKLDQTRDFKEWQSNRYAAIFRFCKRTDCQKRFTWKKKIFSEYLFILAQLL
jgi:hypothetical protein